jgi:APA family basic amino acid/polyamine antiporter
VQLSSFLRRKSVTEAFADTERPGQELKRSLGAFDLTMLGVGAIIGAGIFSSVGDTAVVAGPALAVSYLMTAVACGFAALCYAEIAAMVPIAGSAYSYSYVAFGEVVAWIIGWDLIIEYAIGNIYVAQSWADHFRSFLRGAFGVDFPAWMATDIQTAASAEFTSYTPMIGEHVIAFNLPAALITVFITIVLVIGIRESARFNTGMVLFKLLLLLAFIGIGAFFVQPANWTPFAPNGFNGIWTGASLAFFSYIGFDAVSTAAEETTNPQRNVPRGMIASLAVCTVLYIVTALVTTGLAPSSELGGGDPLAYALRSVGLGSAALVFAVGAMIAMTAVLLVFQLGQTRIFMVMARDGLLPAAFARVHPRFRTPHISTILTGIGVAILPSFMTSDQALHLTSIGTLFAFLLVSAGVIALRRIEPHRPRPFKVPLYPLSPLLAIATCLWLMLGLPASNWWRFGLWLAVGFLIYLVYGYRRSRLGRSRSGAAGQAL